MYKNGRFKLYYVNEINEVKYVDPQLYAQINWFFVLNYLVND